MAMTTSNSISVNPAARRSRRGCQSQSIALLERESMVIPPFYHEDHEKKRRPRAFCGERV
jgi:hypothetical protein